MKNLRRFILILVVLAAVLPAGVVFAQQNGLDLRVRKEFGYNAGSNLRGTFSMQATGPADLRRVEFRVDDQVIGEATAAPFKLHFQTQSYATGWHTLTAVGTLASGETLVSPERRFNFVSAQQQNAGMLRIILPVLVVVFGAIGLQIFAGLKSKREMVALGAKRDYGFHGGAICARCKRPFALRWSALNLGPGLKFQRCPHCGSWAVRRRASPVDLRAAEEAELRDTSQGRAEVEQTPEERLREQIDRSKYL